MESNKKALMILQLLVFTAVIIFVLEKKFLISESRGATLSHYADFAGISDVLLLVEDFEGFDKSDSTDAQLTSSGFFTYGSIGIGLDTAHVDNHRLASATAIKAHWNTAEAYGGWGKGVGANIELNPQTDYINFRILIPDESLEEDQIRVMLQEDDDEDGQLDEQKDDKWGMIFTVKPSSQWQTISLPLKDFQHEGEGGDGILNINRKGGLHNVIFNFERSDKYPAGFTWYFDFICFTTGKLATDLNK
jgi:hypothetical protein